MNSRTIMETIISARLWVTLLSIAACMYKPEIQNSVVFIAAAYLGARSVEQLKQSPSPSKKEE